jgi:hypothetical protein
VRPLHRAELPQTDQEMLELARVGLMLIAHIGQLFRGGRRAGLQRVEQFAVEVLQLLRMGCQGIERGEQFGVGIVGHARQSTSAVALWRRAERGAERARSRR